MADLSENRAKFIINQHVKSFSEEVIKITEYSWKKNHIPITESIFSVLQPVDSELYKYEYYQKILDKLIMEYLIDPIIQDFFVELSLQPEGNNNIILISNKSNMIQQTVESYEQDHIFHYQLLIDGEIKGC